MSTRMRRILVAVGDLRHPPMSELRKAVVLARSSGAGIELFHAIMEADPGRSYPETATARAVARQRATIAGRCQQRLQQFARRAGFRGVATSCTASWDYPPHEAIVRRAQAIKADLVVAATQRHRLGGRLILANTDWELIRQCPVPVLLVKSPRPYRRPVVIVAVDPFHAHARPADLDARLIDSGATMAKSLRGTMQVFHAYMPLWSVEAVPGAPPMIMPPEAEAAHEELVIREVQALAAAAGVPAKSCHVLMGGVAEELDKAARRTRAGLIVMGAVSRSALARLFIGNAAERVLDRVRCDVLVVKPRGFRPKIARVRAVAVTFASAAGRMPHGRTKPRRAGRAAAPPR